MDPNFLSTLFVIGGLVKVLQKNISVMACGRAEGGMSEISTFGEKDLEATLSTNDKLIAKFHCGLLGIIDTVKLKSLV